MRVLKLTDMDLRHRALTPSIAGGLLEAAGVCLHRHHSPPAELAVSDNDIASKASIDWPEPNARVRDAWANSIDATEAGACGCVIAGVEELRGLFAVRRAETGTGADYYVGPTGAGEEDLEDCIRLEISGSDAAESREIARRLQQKIQQAKAGNSDMPAIAGVIGFAALTLLLQDVE